MTWTVVFTPEFEQWLYDQEPGLKNRVNAALLTLELTGPALSRPRVDTLFGSFYPNMKELSLQYAGDPWRICFAFDYSRQAIMLYGAKKTGQKRFYTTLITRVDAIFARYLARKKDRE